MGEGRANTAFEKGVKGLVKMQVIPCTVTAVDTDNYTCDVQPDDGGAEYFGVRLRAAIETGEYGVILIPKEGSKVLVGLINNDDRQAYVCGWSQVDTVYMKCENALQVFGTTVELNGQDFTTLKGAETIAELKKTQAILDAMLQVIKTTPPLTQPANAPSALQVALNGAVSALQGASYTNQLENDTVKHGGGN